MCMLIIPSCRLTCGGSIYSHIDALKVSTTIRYVTVEDSCSGGGLRVTVEKYCCWRYTPGSGECHARWWATKVWDLSFIGKEPLRSRICRTTAGCVGSCAEQSITTSSNIRDVHNTVVSILQIVQEEPDTCSTWQTNNLISQIHVQNWLLDTCVHMNNQ